MSELCPISTYIVVIDCSTSKITVFYLYPHSGYWLVTTKTDSNRYLFWVVIDFISTPQILVAVVIDRLWPRQIPTNTGSGSISTTTNHSQVYHYNDPDRLQPGVIHYWSITTMSDYNSVTILGRKQNCYNQYLSNRKYMDHWTEMWILSLRGPAYVKTASPTNHQNQWKNDVILDCSLSKSYMVLIY